MKTELIQWPLEDSGESISTSDLVVFNTHFTSECTHANPLQANHNMAEQLRQLLLRHETRVHMVSLHIIMSLSIPSTHT